jgi:DNA-binding NarL/FixJ family response regulator
MHSDRRYVTEMLRAGAAGYLLKDCAADELARAIRQVGRGDMYLGAGVTADLVDEYIGRLPESEAGICASLTPREREVLQLLAEGCTTKEAAARLEVSVKTVETHRANMMRRLNLRSLAELTKYAIREGLTSLEP